MCINFCLVDNAAYIGVEVGKCFRCGDVCAHVIRVAEPVLLHQEGKRSRGCETANEIRRIGRQVIGWRNGWHGNRAAQKFRIQTIAQIFGNTNSEVAGD